MSQYINRHNRYISQSPVHVQYMMAIKPDISTHNSSATIQDEIRWFLPARGHARAVLAVIVSVCPSVCPSFTSVCSTKTAKPRITQTTPYDSTKTLGKFLLPKISAKFQRGNPQRGRQFTKLRWRYIRSGNWPKSRFISEKIWTLLLWKANRNSCARYRMALFSVTLGDP